MWIKEFNRIFLGLALIACATPVYSQTQDFSTGTYRDPASVLSLLPQVLYTSTTTIREPDLQWFERNLQKAQNIIDEYNSSTTTWTYQDAFVAAVRYEGLCRWATMRFPRKPPKRCGDVGKVREFKSRLYAEHQGLAGKKPWKWRFLAEEQDQSNRKPSREAMK